MFPFLDAFDDAHFQNVHALWPQWGPGITTSYCIMVTLVMMNLLIARMGDTYNRISESAELEWLLQRARVVWSTAPLRSRPFWGALCTAVPARACLRADPRAHPKDHPRAHSKSHPRSHPMSAVSAVPSRAVLKGPDFFFFAKDRP